MKLLRTIGQEEYGLEKFVQCERSRIAERAQQCLDSELHVARLEHDSADFVYLCKRLFEDVISCEKEKSTFLESVEFSGRSFYLPQNLLEECLIQLEKILLTLFRERNLETYTQRINEETLNLSRSADKENFIDLFSLDIIITELASISNATRRFQLLIEKRINEATLLQNVSDASWLTGGKMLIGSLLDEINKKIQELMGKYVILDAYYIRLAVYKAMNLQGTRKDSSITFMVDDVFYVLQKCIRRGISSLNTDCICTVINHANNILLTEYTEALKKNLSASNWTAVSQHLLQGELNNVSGRVQSENAQKKYITHLNDVESSTSCIIILHNESSEILQKMYLSDPPKRLKVLSCLEAFLQTAKFFDSLLSETLLKTCSTIFYKLVDNMLQGLLDLRYVISDEELLMTEVNDPFMHAFCDGLKQVMQPFKKYMTDTNYAKLCRILMPYIARSYEKVVMQMKFNYNGALRLDKDVQYLLSFLTNLTGISVRNKFYRVLQITCLLTFEKAEEAKEFLLIESDTERWPFTNKEAREILTNKKLIIP